MARRASWLRPFALVYVTFFLDNVLLTVLVPIIPDWVRGAESLEAQAWRDGAPLALLLNGTAQAESGAAVVGCVLAAKALAQLAAAGPAAAAVAARGSPAVLRGGTALLLAAAAVFAWGSARRGAGALWAGAGRALHGAGAALCGVAGLALAHGAAPARHRARATAALLGAVAFGVLVGYPFGGAAYALWNREAPFLLLAAALSLTLLLQYKYLKDEEYNQERRAGGGTGGGAGGSRWAGVAAAAREPPGAACAGAVLLSTAVMAALEPCLPLWIMERFHPQRWVSGVVFVPDSAGYLAACSLAGGGGERGALAGQAALAAAALALPLAGSVRALAAPHAVLGLGLGAVDAALVPALLARGGDRAGTAALLQAAGSAAYVAGPVLGGALAQACGFESTMRALGVLNLLYAAFLYRALKAHPLTTQWGAPSESDSESGPESAELRPTAAERPTAERPTAEAPPPPP